MSICVTTANAISRCDCVRILHPGDVVLAERNVRLETLLGSCVAIILTDRNRTIGAMCHFVHWRPAKDTDENPCVYGDAALDTLYQLVSQRGFNPQLCEAYVYGGGNMFPQMMTEDHIGRLNAKWSIERLNADGVRVISHDLGGNVYRRLGWTVGPDVPQVVTTLV